MLVAADGNGNVTQVLKRSDGSLLARFEYDAYGSPVVAAETYAAAMPLRFSSKWFDAETGLGYWGYRWYHTRQGRWMSRDPIGEAGAVLVRHAAAAIAFIPRDAGPESAQGVDEANVYSGMRNDPTVWSDPLGGSAQKSDGQKQYDAGPMHPQCCLAVFGLCLLQGNGLSQCSRYFDQCWNRAIPNPCHAGKVIDPICWYVRGSKGCKKPDTCFLDLFPLCEVRFGTHPETGQPIYGAHLFRFCTKRKVVYTSPPYMIPYGYTDKWPAGCMEACEHYKRVDKKHAQKNCGRDYHCRKCKDICGSGPRLTFLDISGMR